MQENEFYLQDSRQYVGNDVLWWCKTDGYTTDLSKAQIFTREEAIKQHQSRPSDLPWPKSYIDQKTRPAVDMQYIKHAEALAGTGIEITKEKKQRKEQYRCNGCGVFMSEHDFWLSGCNKCGADSRP